jgi:hypothetical protein
LADDLSGDLLDALPSGPSSLFKARNGSLDGAAHDFSDHSGRLMERDAATALDHTSSVVL